MTTNVKISTVEATPIKIRHLTPPHYFHYDGKLFLLTEQRDPAATRLEALGLSSSKVVSIGRDTSVFPVNEVSITYKV